MIFYRCNYIATYVLGPPLSQTLHNLLTVSYTGSTTGYGYGIRNLNCRIYCLTWVYNCSCYWWKVCCWLWLSNWLLSYWVNWKKICSRYKWMDGFFPFLFSFPLSEGIKNTNGPWEGDEWIKETRWQLMILAHHNVSNHQGQDKEKDTSKYVANISKVTT